MSGNRDDFWKELMGEDFRVDTPDSAAPKSGPDKPPASPAPPRNPGATGDSGFTVDYTPHPAGSTAKTPGVPPQRQTPPPQTQTPPARTPHETPLTPPHWAENGTPPARQGTQYPPSAQDPYNIQIPNTPQDPYGTKRLPDTHDPRADETRRVPDLRDQPRRYYADEEDPAPVAPPRRGRSRKDDGFEVEFDFDAEYPDVNEKALRRGRTRRTGLLSGILLFLFVICVSVVLACLGWMWTMDVLGFDGHDETVEVTLAKDLFHEEQVEEENKDGVTETVTVEKADLDKVADELLNAGLIEHKWLFKLFAQISHADTKVKAGTYTLNLNYDYRAMIHGMAPRAAQRKEVKVVVPEGYTITQIVNLMEENGVCKKKDLLDTLENYDFDYDFLDSSTLGEPKRLEGYLFPDTYRFYENDDPVNVVRKFLNNFENKWTDEFETAASDLGYTRDQILTVASMIEKEAAVDSERDNIASVIYNRLEHPDRQDTGGLLQIDATIYYVTADSGEDFSTDIDSPYNTYMYPGLPEGPIANPGLASIRAALDPADTDFYFYALSVSGTHRFFETYSEFNRFVNSDQFGG